MSKSILNSLIETGAIAEDVLLGALIDTGRISVEKLMEECSATDAEILASLHNRGTLDVLQLIRETVANIRVEIDGMTSQEASAELRKTAVYLESLASIIDNVDSEEDEELAEVAQPITVVRG